MKSRTIGKKESEQRLFPSTGTFLSQYQKRNKQTEQLIKDDFKTKEALLAFGFLVLKKWEVLKRDTFPVNQTLVGN